MPAEIQERFLPTCSVVICTRDRPAHLEQCLSALSRLDYPQFFTVVVDNAPCDDRARQIAARWGARYLVEPLPGLSRARNRGAAASDVEIVAYLDDDALPAPDWLANLVEGFLDPSVMVVTGRVCAPGTEALDETHRRLMRRYQFGGASPFALSSDTAGWLEKIYFPGVGIGANMAFRRRAFEVWKGFDTRLGRGTILEGGEENYAFISLVARGYKIVYDPRAVVQHPCLATKQELWSRYLADLGAHTAFLTLLFLEEPRYRKAILTYRARALMRRLRRSEGDAQGPEDGIARKARAMLARLSGPWLYLRSHWARSA